MNSTAVQVSMCPYCSQVAHANGVGACPKIAEVEYYNDGVIKKVVKRA